MQSGIGRMLSLANLEFPFDSSASETPSVAIKCQAHVTVLAGLIKMTHAQAQDPGGSCSSCQVFPSKLRSTSFAKNHLLPRA